ncbi:serine/threonine protein kinase [Dactylosporangium sp. CS-047395]|uniref:serine/threonine protein kinase n=1 Tax=Dactylosporangium sp. CS-047395 TaxID=3239936 RepID=UPI003D8A4196
MRPSQRTRLATAAGLLTAALSTVLAAPPEAGAAPAGPTAGCAITGVAAGSAADADRLHRELPKQPAHELAGARLDGRTTWTVPGGRPVLVVDSTTGAAPATATASVFGLRFDLPAAAGATKGRYLNASQPPLFGGFTRTVEITVAGTGCNTTLVLTSDRSAYTTVAGIVGLLLALVGGFFTVLLARRPTGGWARRALLAAPLGLLAGAGEGMVLHESGALSPSSGLIWLGPLAGLMLALLLPLTRRRPRHAVAAPVPFAPPSHVDLAGRTVEALFTQSETEVVYRAVEPDGVTRVLLKAPQPQCAGDPAVLAALARDAEVMRLLDDEHCLRLHGAAAPPVVVTQDIDGAPLRRVLAAGTPLTPQQALTAVAGAANGLIALHRLELVHRDVRPDTIYLDRSGRTVLASFGNARPGAEPVPAAEGSAQYLSPEQRRGEPLDARSDLFTLGVVLVELLTGQVPVVAPDAPPAAPAGLHPHLAALIERALALDPAERPPSAEAFLAELSEAATAAYGPDWMTIGAATSAILIPGGALAAAGAVGAGVATAGTGITALGAAEVGAASVPVATSAAGLSAVSSGTTATATSTATSVSGGSAGSLLPLAGAATAVLVGVVLAVAPSTPAAAAQEVITQESARVILVSTWDEARGGSDTHIVTDARPVLSVLLGIPGAAGGELSQIEIGVPPGQTKYPAYFLATAQLKLADGSIVYVYARFTRTSADQPWMMSELIESKIAANVPKPKINADGSLPAAPELVADPSTLPARYVAWGQRVTDSKALGTDDVLALSTSGTSFLAGIPGFVGANGQFYNTLVWKPAGGLTMQPVLLEDGTVLARFNASAAQTLYNSPSPASRPCVVGNTTVSVQFGFPGFPTGKYREVTVDWAIAVTAHVPVKGAAAAKVTIEDTSLPTNPRSTPC